jgi:ethanolamine utilization microcompartment shell protein EutS
MAELRCYVFRDSLQPQIASFLGTVAQGFLPVPGQASLFVEVAPGMDIMRVTDVALKATDVRPGMMIIERLYGMLEVHSDSQADVRAAGRAILAALDLKEEERIKPEIFTSQVIRNISDYHTQLINRTRHGDLILPGQSLYVMECAPAGYAAIAANEAEKAANINILEVRAFGSFGRVYLGGEEKDIDVGYRAAEQAIADINGRPARSGRD